MDLSKYVTVANVVSRRETWIEIEDYPYSSDAYAVVSRRETWIEIVN